MPRLVSLLCQGCLLRLEKYSLFDDDKKRSCYGKCHHSLCEQCVTEDPYQDCPVCGEPKSFEKKTIDYAASRVYEDLLNRPIDIFREWWNSETVDTGHCALCREEERGLRVCIKCEMKLPKWEQCIHPIQKEEERITISVPDTKYEFSVFNYSTLPDFFSRVYCSDCLIDRHEEIEERNIKRIENIFRRWGWYPEPEDLELHKQEKSEMLKLKDLKDYVEEMKRHTFKIAKELLWKSLNRMKEKEFCKLRFWRLFRTYEALMYFSGSLCNSDEEKEGEEVVIEGLDVSKWNSELSKFCKGFKKVGTSDFSEEIVEKLINNFEVQLEEVKKIQTKCECAEIYERMHKWKWRNSVDQIFVKMVESVDFINVSECLLRRDSQLYEELQECYKKAEEMFQWKLHLIPTVVCWSESINSDDLCCLFDDKNRKPYKCWQCDYSICAECWWDENIKCPVCGSNIDDWMKHFLNKTEPTVNTEIIELVNFYKKNCVDLYEKWWNSEPVPFCLKCNSYSTQLEICAFCELSEKRSSLECNADQNADFLFKAVGLKSLLLRTQCSHCPIRLQSDRRYMNCEEAQDSAQLSFRGCNHLRYRINDRLCRAEEFTSSKNSFNAIALNSIDNFKYAWKLATIEILHQILNSAVEDVDTCKLREMRFLKIVGNLKNRTYKYLNLGIQGKLVNEEVHLKGIQKTIDILKFQWTELQGDNENCRCKELWDRESSKEQLWKLFKTTASFQLDQKLEGCPLEFNHGFKTSPEDDFSLEFHNLTE